jgi:hypothetical protein
MTRRKIDPSDLSLPTSMRSWNTSVAPAWPGDPGCSRQSAPCRGPGASYITAAHMAGRRSGDAVAHLVARFNREGSVP